MSNEVATEDESESETTVNERRRKSVSEVLAFLEFYSFCDYTKAFQKEKMGEAAFMSRFLTKEALERILGMTSSDAEELLKLKSKFPGFRKSLQEDCQKLLANEANQTDTMTQHQTDALADLKKISGLDSLDSLIRSKTNLINSQSNTKISTGDLVAQLWNRVATQVIQKDKNKKKRKRK